MPCPTFGVQLYFCSYVLVGQQPRSGCWHSFKVLVIFGEEARMSRLRFFPCLFIIDLFSVLNFSLSFPPGDLTYDKSTDGWNKTRLGPVRVISVLSKSSKFTVNYPTTVEFCHLSSPRCLSHYWDLKLWKIMTPVKKSTQRTKVNSQVAEQPA